ncbi:hypothetical protein WMY93_022373 [Mugilogobius chulae]|uniref:Inosine/uridine-preferring nucleoside hydrolase domain-containing protein n=1 Tax=Mugilogobius chulae TaxID=88201 RepID=A0AAW0N6T6_9GOBI
MSDVSNNHQRNSCSVQPALESQRFHAGCDSSSLSVQIGLHQPDPGQTRTTAGLQLVSLQQTGVKMKKLWVDLDTGVDDAQALMLALSTPDVEILGISCCHGNTPLENVLENTLRVLRVCGRLDIPVYKGCARPLLAVSSTPATTTGRTDSGRPGADPPSLDLLQKKRAAQALIKAVNNNPGEVILVATAPLTNLAVAVQLAPGFPKKLKSLFLMGGNVDSRGNTTVCGDTSVTSYLGQCTEKANFMTKITAVSRRRAQSQDYQKEVTDGQGFNSCDCYAMAAASVRESDAGKRRLRWVVLVLRRVSVELEGAHTRGMMVVDYMQLLKKKHKAHIMKKFDLEKFKVMLKNSLKCDMGLSGFRATDRSVKSKTDESKTSPSQERQVQVKERQVQVKERQVKSKRDKSSQRTSQRETSPSQRETSPVKERQSKSSKRQSSQVQVKENKSDQRETSPSLSPSKETVQSSPKSERTSPSQVTSQRETSQSHRDKSKSSLKSEKTSPSQVLLKRDESNCKTVVLRPAANILHARSKDGTIHRF